MLRFEKREYVERLNNIKHQMDRAGIEVLCDADPANIYYATGADSQAYFTPQLMVISIYEEEPIVITRKMDVPAVLHTAYLSQSSVVGYPESMVHRPTQNPMKFAAEYIQSRGWGAMRLGVEMDAWNFTPRDFLVLQQHLPNATIVDSNMLINWARLVKSPQEIAYMKQAGKIQEEVMQTAVDLATPGMRECDLVGEIYRAQMRGTEEFGGDYSAYHVSLLVAERSNTPHLTWTEKPLAENSLFTAELGAVRHRYHSPMARTIFLGKTAPQELIDTAKYTIEGFDTTLSKIKVGMTGHEVNEVWEAYNTKYELKKDSRIAYSIGASYPPVWQEKTANFARNDFNVLTPNQTYHMIIGIWFENWGLEVSEAIYITENGAETFANFPRELFVKN